MKFCDQCHMEIPNFATRCPYCRSSPTAAMEATHWNAPLLIAAAINVWILIDLYHRYGLMGSFIWFLIIGICFSGAGNHIAQMILIYVITLGMAYACLLGC